MITCHTCHQPKPAAAFQSLASPIRLTKNCADCRARFREYHNRPARRTYEMSYWRIDRAGLGCLNCPLAECVFVADQPIYLCPK